MEISPAQPWLWDVSQGSSDLCLADKRKITFPKKTPQQVHLVLFEVPPSLAPTSGPSGPQVGLGLSEPSGMLYLSEPPPV